ncbi:MAG: hypothetical protein V1872_09745 [bacterium]
MDIFFKMKEKKGSILLPALVAAVVIGLIMVWLLWFISQDTVIQKNELSHDFQHISLLDEYRNAVQIEPTCWRFGTLSKDHDCIDGVCTIKATPQDRLYRVRYRVGKEGVWQKVPDKFRLSPSRDNIWVINEENSIVKNDPINTCQAIQWTVRSSDAPDIKGMIIGEEVPENELISQTEVTPKGYFEPAQLKYTVVAGKISDQ